MLDLDSQDWGKYRHAYGEASDIPSMFAKLRAASRDNWETVYEEFFNTIAHQGDVYTATYAIAPHLLDYAIELGPCKQSDDLLFSIAYASRGDRGPEVPEDLEEAWEDTQEGAREVILERLLDSQTSEDYTGCLISGLLYLSGEWSSGATVNDWCWGYSMVACCSTCETEKEVFWHKGAPTQLTSANNFEVVSISPSSYEAMTLAEDFEFEEDTLPQQIISLAAISGHASVEKQMRLLYGTLRCGKCGSDLPLLPRVD